MARPPQSLVEIGRNPAPPSINHSTTVSVAPQTGASVQDQNRGSAVAMTVARMIKQARPARQRASIGNVPKTMTRHFSVTTAQQAPVPGAAQAVGSSASQTASVIAHRRIGGAARSKARRSTRLTVPCKGTRKSAERHRANRPGSTWEVPLGVTISQTRAGKSCPGSGACMGFGASPLIVRRSALLS